MIDKNAEMLWDCDQKYHSNSLDHEVECTCNLFHSKYDNPWYTCYWSPVKDSWWGYMRDKTLNTNTYEHGQGLPRDLTQILTLVYATLSDDTLLERA